MAFARSCCLALLCIRTGIAIKVDKSGKSIALDLVGTRKIRKTDPVLNESASPDDPALNESEVPDDPALNETDPFNENAHDCNELSTILDDLGLNSFNSIVSVVCGNPDYRTSMVSLPNGTLLAPKNSYVHDLWGVVESPNPDNFMACIEAAFVPDGLRDGAMRTVLGTEIKSCTTSSGANGISSEGGPCIVVDCNSGRTSTTGVQICLVEGLVLEPTLDKKYTFNKKRQATREEQERQRKRLLVNASASHAAQPPTSHVTIPLEFIVCDNSYGTTQATTSQINDQIAHLNEAYGGIDTCTNEVYTPEKPDMMMNFALDSITTVTDIRCGISCSDYFFEANGHSHSMLSQHAAAEAGKVKVFVCNDRAVLGQATLGASDTDGGLLIADTTLPGGGSSLYSFGDNLVHQLGRYFGLPHTFGTVGSCDEGYDVGETNFEENPYFGPITFSTGMHNSCGTPDPILNFMDYTDDAGRCTFTEGQKSRAWSHINSHMPVLAAGPPTPAPTPPTPAPTPTPEPTEWPTPAPTPKPTPMYSA